MICCIVDFHLKEEILKKAHTKAPLTHNGMDTRLFQDLSGITLHRRRELRPLLLVLHANGIVYRWKFPFGLSASNPGRTTLLRIPEDLCHFCDTLEIPLTEVPEWYAEFQPATAWCNPPISEPMETQETHYRRQRSPSETRAQFPTKPQR